MTTASVRPLAFAVLLATAGPVGVHAADTAGAGPMLVTGEAPSVCRISPATSGTGGTNVTFSSGGVASASVTVTALVDPATAKTRATAGAVQFQVICTGAHTLTVSTASGGLVNTAPSAAGNGFSSRADYTLQAAWDGATRSLTTRGSAASLDLSGADAVTGALTVTITVPPGQGPLVAGAYQDTISIDLSAN